MGWIRSIAVPSVLIALGTAAVAPEVAAVAPTTSVGSLGQVDTIVQLVIRFAELLGVLFVGLKFILRPMLDELLAPIKAEQTRVATRLAAGDERFEELHDVVREIGTSVDALSRDVAVALDRTDK